jgi:hypothetical protein
MTASTVPLASRAAPAALKWWPVNEPGVRARSAAMFRVRGGGGFGGEAAVPAVTGALTGRSSRS